MESLYLLVPVVLLMLVAAVGVLFWAINNGQYDDLDKESRRILLDDEEQDQDQDCEQQSDDDGNQKQPVDSQ